jgi:hypothetical protein
MVRLGETSGTDCYLVRRKRALLLFSCAAHQQPTTLYFQTSPARPNLQRYHPAFSNVSIPQKAGHYLQSEFLCYCLNLLHCGERSFALLLAEPHSCVGERKDTEGGCICNPLSKGDAADDSTVIGVRRYRNGARNAIQSDCTCVGDTSGFRSDLLSWDRRRVGPYAHVGVPGGEFNSLGARLFRRRLFRTTVCQSEADGALDVTLPSLVRRFHAPTELPRARVSVHARLRCDGLKLARNPGCETRI